MPRFHIVLASHCASFAWVMTYGHQMDRLHRVLEHNATSKSNLEFLVSFHFILFSLLLCEIFLKFFSLLQRIYDTLISYGTSNSNLLHANSNLVCCFLFVCMIFLFTVDGWPTFHHIYRKKRINHSLVGC